MFTDLTSENYPQIVPFFANQVHRLCYYNPSAFIAWSHHVGKPVWHTENNILFIGMNFFSAPEKNYLVLPLAGGKNFYPDKLYDYAQRFGFPKFQYVPEDYLQYASVDRIEHYFNIVEQYGFEDYIYSTSDLAELKGKKYSKKRNLINQFSTLYYDREKVEITPLSSSDTDECLEFLMKWTQNRNIDVTSNSDAACEYKANVNALINIDTLGFKGVILRINNEVRAFGIGSQLTGTLGGFNFEKADPDIKGLYQFFDKQCVRRLFPDTPMINKECDMGEPGLRQAKRSYYPVDTVKSYQLVLK